MPDFPATFDAMIEGKYLKKEDCPEPNLVTIARFDRENVAREGDEPEVKWIVHFEGMGKPLVLNVTNLQILKSLFGSPANAIGKRVVLYTDPNVSFGGKLVGGLRLRGPRATPKPAAQVADFEDDIPF